VILGKYYRILGLEEGASQTEIRKAYRSLAKKLHPDRNSSDVAHEQFIKIKEAYEVLTGERPIPNAINEGQFTNACVKQQSTNAYRIKKTPEQKLYERAYVFKKHKERLQKIELVRQLKRYQPLRSGWRLKLFNLIVVFSIVCLLIVTLDYFLPSRISKHQVNYWILEGYSNFYATNTYILNFDDNRAASIIGNGVLHLSEDDIFFIEKTRIMKEPRAIYMPTKLEYWKLEFTESMFSFLPYVYMLLLIPLGAWYVRNNIWFFHYWFYPTIYATGPFLLYFLLDELRVLRIIQLF
jgi:hypothetical protein